MTTQTKKFINFEDIISYRFNCKRCGAELCLPLQVDLNKTEPVNTCPNCKKEWAKMNDGTGGISIAGSLAKFAEAIQKISQWPGGCEITLEIKPDAPPKASPDQSH
jgi:transcription elongation factor Elf1